jgi:hypothetical protein
MMMMMSEHYNGHRSVWQQVSTVEPSFGLVIYSHFLPLRTPPTEQWEERGGGWFSLHITCVGGRKEGGGEGMKRSSPDYQDCREKSDHSYLVRQGFLIILCLGKMTLYQDQFPAIHPPPRSTQRKIIYENDHNNIIFLCSHQLQNHLQVT